MKENFNKSIPSVSYNTAMTLLAGKLAIHSRSIGKNAERAFVDALVHARDAAHARAFSKLESAGYRDLAIKEAEDIAQSVAVMMFDGRFRARLISQLPKLSTEACRKAFFGRVINCAISTVMRRNLRGPRFVSLESRAGMEDSRKLVDFIDELESPSLLPDAEVALLDSIKRRAARENQRFFESKAGGLVRAAGSAWTPMAEVSGRCDESDRPSEDVLPKRSRQRWLKEARDAIDRSL